MLFLRRKKKKKKKGLIDTETILIGRKVNTFILRAQKPTWLPWVNCSTVGMKEVELRGTVELVEVEGGRGG